MIYSAFISLHDLQENGLIIDNQNYLLEEAGFEELRIINVEYDSIYFRYDYEDLGDVKDLVTTLVHLMLELGVVELKIKVDA